MQRFLVPVVWRDDQGAIVNTSSAFAHPFVTIEVSAPGKRQWHRTHAMIDTGMSRTAISPDLSSKCGLEVSGTVQLSGSAGMQDFSLHQMELRFPNIPNGIIDVEGAIMDHPLGNTRAEALVGMDVLRLGRLLLDQPGSPSYIELLPERATVR